MARKKMTRREIKKLKQIEVKREPFKKLNSKENKEKEEVKNDAKEKSEFHETILEESTDFVVPVIESEKKEQKDEKIENLEEFASTISSTDKKIEENPYSNKTSYDNTGIGGGNYDNKRYDDSGRYDTGVDFNQGNIPGSLRTNVINPFQNPALGNRVDERGKEGLTANRLEESARITQQYREEREANIRGSSPHRTKSKREIF